MRGLSDGDRIRSVLQFVSGEGLTDSRVWDKPIGGDSFISVFRDLFGEWLLGSRPMIMNSYREMISFTGKPIPTIPPPIPPPIPPQVQIDNVRSATAALLYSICGFYKFCTRGIKPGRVVNLRGHYHKNGAIIYSLLNSLVNGELPNSEVIKDINLKWYWREDIASALADVVVIAALPPHI